MSNELFTSIVTIATAIVGLAIVSVLVSNKAQTAGVINAAGNAFGYDLGVAVSPVTGNAQNLSPVGTSSFGLPAFQ